jgi:2-polyprenyl-6-methoxyphenol hydroxylase-like FAD-dependent oxidoreductase
MGTTLALLGAYNLAGAFKRNPNDLDQAFSEYEKKMRPAVDSAQKLIPGMPWIISPETEWGVWFMNNLLWFLLTTGVINLLFKLKSEAKENFHVEDFGFEIVQNQSESTVADG